jgi:hypothetical protein
MVVLRLGSLGSQSQLKLKRRAKGFCSFPDWEKSDISGRNNYHARVISSLIYISHLIYILFRYILTAAQ